jgi:hypothetical protein
MYVVNKNSRNNYGQPQTIGDWSALYATHSVFEPLGRARYYEIPEIVSHYQDWVNDNRYEDLVIIQTKNKSQVPIQRVREEMFI